MKHRAELRLTSQTAAMYAPSVIGLDLGDKWSRYCVLDCAGVILEEDRVRSSAEALQNRFGQLPSLCTVIETGAHSPWVSRVLEAMGHSVVVANARKLRMI
jgi:transposase